MFHINIAVFLLYLYHLFLELHILVLLLDQFILKMVCLLLKFVDGLLELGCSEGVGLDGEVVLGLVGF